MTFDVKSAWGRDSDWGEKTVSMLSLPDSGAVGHIHMRERVPRTPVQNMEIPQLSTSPVDVQAPIYKPAIPAVGLNRNLAPSNVPVPGSPFPLPRG